MLGVFIAEPKITPEYAKYSILMRGDNSSSVTWENKFKGMKEARAGALIRTLGCVDTWWVVL